MLKIRRQARFKVQDDRGRPAGSVGRMCSSLSPGRGVEPRAGYTGHLQTKSLKVNK